ncbi:hypothetical protein GGR57DRAFT_361905 [Xylariaceae sp. FL1272]|nr:hypothetical protein GGR57DRAFT_361905 [Xylariaceae sp. FL1272]
MPGNNDLRRYFSKAGPGLKNIEAPPANISQPMDLDSDADELSLPVVTSDLARRTAIPGQHVDRNTPSRPQRRQTSIINHTTSQHSQPSIAPSSHDPSLHTPSRMRLAVHIRSSPVSTPFTPINEPPDFMASRLKTESGKDRKRQPVSDTLNAGPNTSDAVTVATAHENHVTLGPKKRGRPKGWRKPQVTESMGGTEAKRRKKEEAANNQDAKRRGRPPRPPDMTAREWYEKSNPDFMPYKCEWDISHEEHQLENSICPAELHNLDTLRRHVSLIHGEDDPLICRYPKCKAQKNPQEFLTLEEFERHMEDKHFIAYLWHWGEGYKNNGIETLEQDSEKLPSYLFNANGEQVTPSIKGQAILTDAEMKLRMKKVRQMQAEQNAKAPSDAEWAKQILGTAS